MYLASSSKDWTGVASILGFLRISCLAPFFSHYLHHLDSGIRSDMSKSEESQDVSQIKINNSLELLLEYVNFNEYDNLVACFSVKL